MANVTVGTPEPEEQPEISEVFAVREDCDPPHDKSQLPWWFLRRAPNIAGTIILINQSQEPPEFPNLIIRIISLLHELIWLFSNDSIRRADDRTHVTTIRVRCSNGEKSDASFIGYIRPDAFTLGDDVWLWGWYCKGRLIVRKGYNWISRSIIAPSSFIGLSSLFCKKPK